MKEILLIIILFLLNIILIIYLYKFRKNNLELSNEKDKYKYKLLSVKELESDLITQEKYYYALIKIEEIISNNSNFKKIYSQIIKIISHETDSKLIYLLEFIKNENKFIFIEGIGYDKKVIKNNIKKEFYDDLLRFLNSNNQLNIENEVNLKNKKYWLLFDNQNSLKSGINFIINNPINPQRKIILGIYSENHNNFSQLEIDFLKQIVKFIEKLLEKTFHLEQLNFFKIKIKETKQKLLNKNNELDFFDHQLDLINQLNNFPFETLDNPLKYYLEKVTIILNIDIAIISDFFIDTHNIIVTHNSLSNNIILNQLNYLIEKFSDEILKENKTIFYQEKLDSNLSSNILIPKDLKINFYVGKPMKINDNISGFLHLFNIDKHKNNFRYKDTIIEYICQGIIKIINQEESELEKQQINIALRESQERLTNMLFPLEDVIWSIHPQTLQLIYINPAAEILFKSPLSNFFQKRTYWLELVHPQQKEQIKEIYSNLFNISLLGNNLASHDIEYRILLDNGEEKYVRDRAYAVYDDLKNLISIDGIITDITNRTKIQKALEKSEEELRLIFELAPIGMMITNLEGQIIQVNNSFCELLQYPFSDIINQNETFICHPDDQEKCSLFKEKIITQYLDQDRQERRFLAYNGSVVFTVVNVTALRNNRGEIIQFIQQIIDISEIKIMEEQIFYDAFHDKLTGLPNRFLLIDRLKQFLNRIYKKPDNLCAILLIDVDQFKKINDSLGHKIGDELLILIADKIVNCVKENDTVARISSDEFLVFLPDINSEKQAYKTAINILTSCKFNTIIEKQTIFSSVSIGITFSSFGYDKSEEMIRDADLAMYQAKEKGRNCYQVFNPTMHKDLVKRLSLESALRKALENKELELYYQPIINLDTGIIAGFEALIRWLSPIYGFISPIEFIPIAEETGLIISLGKWILNTAAKQVKQWQNKYPNLSLFIAVNVSSKQLLNSDFLKQIDEMLTITEVNPSGLKIEITETIFMDNYEQAKDILQKIQARNIRISLDDFGTGYSSLSYLHRLPFNTLKIDRAFIQPLMDVEQKYPIVEAIINLAHNLSLEVVAEGIETETQEEILQKLNCNYGQGYLYSKPMNVDNAQEFIKNQLLKNRW